MKLGNTEIVDTFAEAFRMRFARLIVTAADEYWLEAALRELTGYGASVIGCDAEAGVECRVDAAETPDGRLGAAVLLFGFSTDALAKAVPNRVGQCVMTCPTTAVFNGTDEVVGEAADEVPLGSRLRYFGDGYQKSKLLGETRYWRVPVMDGEFLVEESAGVGKGIAGGNIILQAVDQETALAAARRASDAVAQSVGVVAPFPGGVVRSGSKVGSKYPKMVASSNHAFCPTLRGSVDTELADGVNCAYEIVINGVDESAVAASMRAAIEAAAGEGVPAISAGNYGGKLGKFHFRLHEIMQQDASA